MMADIEWRAAAFFFAVFTFLFSGITGVLKYFIGRQITGLDARLTMIEEDIEEGSKSRNAMAATTAKSFADIAVRQARMEERLKTIPSQSQFADLSREVGEIKQGQIASARQLDLIAEHILKPEARGK